MRPYKVTDHMLQPDNTVSLYVRKMDTTSDFGLYRLLWWDGQSDYYCMAEGECSRKAFKRRYEAIAYGQKHYGEIATPLTSNWGRSNAA